MGLRFSIAPGEGATRESTDYHRPERLSYCSMRFGERLPGVGDFVSICSNSSEEQSGRTHLQDMGTALPPRRMVKYHLSEPNLAKDIDSEMQMYHQQRPNI
jgi:hypothetical protein